MADKIFIDFENEYIGERLAEELAVCLDDAEIIVGAGEGFILSDTNAPSYGLYLSDNFEWLPVSALALNIQQSMGKSLERLKLKPFKESVFVGMTSVCGGSGLSSSAIALGRIYSRLYGFKTLYIPFDRFAFYGSDQVPDTLDLQKLVYYSLSGKEISARDLKSYIYADEYGLLSFRSGALFNPLCTDDFKGIYGFLSAAAESGLFERVILDIPYNCAFVRELLSVCEKKIIVAGPDERGRRLSEKAAEYFPGKKEMLVHEYDEFSFENGQVDIHGQFGAEVREIAERIELY